MTEFFVILSLLFWGMCRELTYENYRNKNLLKILFLLFWLYAGLRYRVGTDTFWYMELFDFFPEIDEFKFSNLFDYRIEPLWILYNSLLKFICSDFIIVQITTSLIFNLALFKFLSRNSKYIFTSLTLYFVLDYLLMNFEFMRQTTALGLYYLFVHKYLENKNYKVWGVGTIICGFMHNTVFFCLLFPFMKRINLSTKKLLIIVGSCLLLVLSNQVFSILSYIVPAEISAAEKITAYRDNITTIYNFNFFIVKFYMFFIVFIGLLLKHDKNTGIIVLYLIVLALTATHDIFDRLHYCICCFYYVYYAELIVLLLKKRSKVLSLVLIVIISVPNLIYFSHGYGGKFYVYQKIFPYYSYLNPQKSPIREQLQNGSEQFNFIFK